MFVIGIPVHFFLTLPINFIKWKLLNKHKNNINKPNIRIFMIIWITGGLRAIFYSDFSIIPPPRIIPF